jgi:DNA-binding CsgD family transcriptional regulator
MQQRGNVRVACDGETVARIIDSVRGRTVVGRLRLSRREQQIVEAMLYGMDTEVRIADRLRMSPRTVQTHVHRLREKTHATSREQILATLLLACLAGGDTAN